MGFDQELLPLFMMGPNCSRTVLFPAMMEGAALSQFAAVYGCRPTKEG